MGWQRGREIEVEKWVFVAKEQAGWRVGEGKLRRGNIRTGGESGET